MCCPAKLRTTRPWLAASKTRDKWSDTSNKLLAAPCLVKPLSVMPMSTQHFCVQRNNGFVYHYYCLFGRVVLNDKGTYNRHNRHLEHVCIYVQYISRYIVVRLVAHCICLTADGNSLRLLCINASTLPS
jgi:hypothetical protein